MNKQNMLLIFGILIIAILWLYLRSYKEGYLKRIDKLQRFQIEVYGYNYKSPPVFYLNNQKLIPADQYSVKSDYLVYNYIFMRKSLTNICSSHLIMKTSDKIQPIVHLIPTLKFGETCQKPIRMKVNMIGGDSLGDETIWKLSC